MQSLSLAGLKCTESAQFSSAAPIAGLAILAARAHVVLLLGLPVYPLYTLKLIARRGLRRAAAVHTSPADQLLGADDTFRAPMVAAVADDTVGLGGFWVSYEAMSEASRAQVIGPLMNKLRAFLLRDFVRQVVGRDRGAGTGQVWAARLAARTASAWPAAAGGAGRVARVKAGVSSPSTTRRAAAV